MSRSVFKKPVICYDSLMIINNMKAITIILSFIGLSLVFYILYIGKSIFIPLVIAIIIWYIIIALAMGYEKIKIAGFRLPHWLAMILSLATFALTAWIFIGFLNNSVNEVIAVAPKYQAKFQIFINDINIKFNLAEIISYNGIFDYINISNLAAEVAGIITTIAGFTTMIIIYVIFLFLEYRTFDYKITELFPNAKNRQSTEALIQKIVKDINTYLKIKTLISVATALCCYLVLIIMGIQFAGFWAVLVFILNYIPNIGSLVAVILPGLFTIVQYDLTHALLLMILLTSIQMTLGNFIEPRLMGRSLNLSPLVIITSLVLWGSIWGIVGMFLCVPIMVILNIILGKFDSTRPIAILLSSEGKLDA